MNVNKNLVSNGTHKYSSSFKKKFLSLLEASGVHEKDQFIYSLVPNTESDSRQWHLLPILLPDITFLGHRDINKLLLCKMHNNFLSQRFRFCLRVFCQTLFPNQRTQFRITSSEMKLAVSAWVSTESKKISNDHELIQSDPTSCAQNQKGK